MATQGQHSPAANQLTFDGLSLGPDNPAAVASGGGYAPAAITERRYRR